jgi:hypothetical protein
MPGVVVVLLLLLQLSLHVDGKFATIIADAQSGIEFGATPSQYTFTPFIVSDANPMVWLTYVTCCLTRYQCAIT